MKRRDVQTDRAYFLVASVHHVHGTECLCGFSSHVARVRTEHILDQFLAALEAQRVEEQ